MSRSIVLCFFLLLPSEVFAQLSVHKSVASAFVIPTGSFQEHVPPSIGGIAFAGLDLPNSPVIAGVELGLFKYGHRASYIYSVSETNETLIAEHEVNAFVTGHLIVRIQNSNRRFRPYAEGGLGVKYFFSEFGFNDAWSSLDDRIHGTDGTYSYGVGAGFEYLMFREFFQQIHLNLGARYLGGGPSEYRIARRNEEARHFRSGTHMIMPFIGISFHR